MNIASKKHYAQDNEIHPTTKAIVVSVAQIVLSFYIYNFACKYFLNRSCYYRNIYNNI